jgi:hypothetical protein
MDSLTRQYDKFIGSSPCTPLLRESNSKKTAVSHNQSKLSGSGCLITTSPTTGTGPPFYSNCVRLHHGSK